MGNTDVMAAGAARPWIRRAPLVIGMLAAATIGIVLAIAAPARGYSELRYVVRVLDGDTIEVAPPGQTDGPVDVIRFAGVNTNESNMCHGPEATARTTELIEHQWVTLSADDPGSMASDGERFLRFVDIGDLDVGLTLLEENLAFALPTNTEPSRNQLYGEASKNASIAGQGIWDPAACGDGPAQDTPLRMIIDWDAPGQDDENLNGEYFRIHNDGDTALSLDGWQVRDTSTTFFSLPSIAEIPAHGYITIHAGAGTSTASHVYLDHQNPTLFRNGSDAGFLLDPDDDIRAFFYYPCLLYCSDPMQGKLSITANWDAEGSDGENPNGEWIDIRNTSDATVDLFDYTLANLPHRYDFPDPTPIPSGGKLRLFIGSGTNTTDTQYWGMSGGILSNTSDTILIETYDRIEIARFDYPCTGVCTDPLQGKIEMTANYDAEGIDEQNPNGEWINFTNTSDGSIDLDGYVIRVSGHTYYFDADPLHPGERLRFHIGVGTDSRLEKYWNLSTKALNNNGDVVSLTSADMTLIDRLEWPCSPCGPVPSLEITDWQWEVPGPDEPNDEWIQIENTGAVAVDLRDWMLRDNNHGLDFADSRVLGPGQKLKVFVGTGTDTASTMYWGLDDVILFSNDRLELWTPHRDLRSCHAWGTQSCGPVVVPPTCSGRDATIVGTPGDDVLVGTSSRDIIVGLGGNDYIDGGTGGDFLCGDSGRDTIMGGKGSDVINGGSGKDTLDGGPGGDKLNGSSGRDIVYGRSGEDILKGKGGDDKLYGGTDDDVNRGGGGTDLCRSGTPVSCER